MNKKSGYLEVEHTADWALKVWSETLPGLFYEASRGMLHLTGAIPGTGAGERQVSVRGFDAESLLVNYLTELVLLGEEDGLMIAPEYPTIETFTINMRFPVFHIAQQEKEIKAVTYHQLNVREVSGGYETTIVFDV